MENHNIIDAHFLTYVAGVLIPTTNISWTAAFNSIPTATISMPAYPQLYGIGRKDRIPVHIFYKDIVSGVYVLLFEGEVTGFSYSSTIASRDITINAQGVLTFLQDVNINFMSSLEDVLRSNVQGNKDTALHTYTPSIVFPMSLFMFGIAPVSENELITYPSQYLDNIIKYLVEAGTKSSSMGDNNDSVLAAYYAAYSKLLNLPRRYTHISYFDQPLDEVWPITAGDETKAFPLIAGMQKKAAMDQLSRLANEGVHGGTVLQLVNMVVNQLEYEFAFFSSPIYSSGRMVSMALKPMLYDALPPSCNILYMSQVLRLDTSERVYGIPTRVKATDVNGVFAILASGITSPIKEFGMVDYYPTNKYRNDVVDPSKTEDQVANGTNYFATEILDLPPGEIGYVDDEKFTGPWVYQTATPAWMSYVGPAAVGTNLKVFKDRMMARLLHHKQHEMRTMQVSCAFSPYVVPGFPAAAFDSHDAGFAFAGHVFTVTHSVSKNTMSTSVEMGFVRLVEEAVVEPIANPIESIDKVTKDKARLSKVYDDLLGAPAITWEEVAELRTNSDAQEDPFAAYCAQYRPLMTMDEYLAFMGMSSVMGVIGDGDEVPIVLYGEFVEKRRDPNAKIVDMINPNFYLEGQQDSITGLRKVLKTIAEKEFSMSVYQSDGTVRSSEAKPANSIGISDIKKTITDMFA